MRILLLGKDGQVGWELQRSLAVLGEVVALDRLGQGALVGDLQDLTGLERTLAALRPDIIVNAAAYTAVDKAESEPDLAHVINAQAPAVLARGAAALGAWLVHYSTDYVFDGGGTTPWAEDAHTGPLSVYGTTKLAGEEAIRVSGCQHLIFRTSWVYAARGNNFVKTMLRLAKERDELRVVADQVGAPTGAELLADSTAHAIWGARQSPSLSGTYHLSAAGETSWWDYARFAIGQARAQGVPIRVSPDRVLPIRTADYPTPATRPLNSRLATSNFRRAFGLCLPPWQEGVTRMLQEGPY